MGGIDPYQLGAGVSQTTSVHKLVPAYLPLISLAVAVLLYYSGLNVDLHYLDGPTRRSVFWLVGISNAFNLIDGVD